MLHNLKAYGTLRPFGNNAFSLLSLLLILVKYTLTIRRVCVTTLLEYNPMSTLHMYGAEMLCVI